LTDAGEDQAGALEHAMISLEDCIAFSGLDEDEVNAISEHEHIPEIAAAALANYLLKQPHGGEAIRAMIIDDIHKALEVGRVRHAQELFMALRHFLDQHPEARAGVES
jgi:hypothetical protein